VEGTTREDCLESDFTSQFTDFNLENKVVSKEGYIVNVGSPTSTRDKANLQYISEVQTSPYKPVLWG